MAMTILNNTAAALTLGELNKNISEIGKQLKKISQGQRITGAGDGASEYAISEKMRTRIRALEQDDRNVQNGHSLVRIASGGIESIIDELRSLKELALNAANDTNTDIDRLTLQKEFDQRRENIDDIASETNYNGKTLLDGTYSKKSIDITTTTVVPGTPGIPSTAPSWATPIDPDNVGPTGAIVHSGVEEPTGTPVQINTSDYTISQSGVYMLTNESQNVTIGMGVHDVKFVQASGTTLTNIHITGPSDGSANLWIEDLTVTNSDTSSFIKFQGANNRMNFKGMNIINIPGDPYNPKDAIYSVINVGEGLTVEGGSDGRGNITFNDSIGIYGALIGSDGGRYRIGEMSQAPITVNSGTYTSNVSASARYGALIGSGNNGSIGDIVVNGGTFIDTSKHDVTIGSGSAGAVVGMGVSKSYCGDITVRNATVVALNKTRDTAIGNGATDGDCGNIYVSNCAIQVKSGAGAGIGSSAGHYNAETSPELGNITVENTVLVFEGGQGAGIGTGQGGHVGNITVNNCDLTQVVSAVGEYVGRGHTGIVGTVTVNGTEILPNDPTNLPGGTQSNPDTQDQIITETETRTVWNPLVIHEGTKANEAINIFINDMRTKALKGTITDDSGAFINSEDLDQLRNLSHDPKKRQAYENILREADGKTLDDVSVTTQYGASVSLRVIDGALEYALNEATTMGAYLSRLEHTSTNIVITNENTVASESTIRDADMAQGMVKYARANVLLQASQSMLAQANQTSSSVLSLLQ